MRLSSAAGHGVSASYSPTRPRLMALTRVQRRGDGCALCIVIGKNGWANHSTAAIVDWRNDNSFGHIIIIEDL
jgi:Tfp pilus assembly ATPase PilU